MCKTTVHCYIHTYIHTYVHKCTSKVLYACSLPSLANINSLFFFNFQKDFYSSCKFRTGKMVLMSNPKIGGGDLMLLPLYQYMYIQALQGVLVNVITALDSVNHLVWLLFTSWFYCPTPPPIFPTHLISILQCKTDALIDQKSLASAITWPSGFRYILYHI